MERTETPALQRKLPATAIPRSYSHRAHLRLYCENGAAAMAAPSATNVPILQAVLQEANELLAITVSSIKTARLAKDRPK